MLSAKLRMYASQRPAAMAAFEYAGCAAYCASRPRLAGTGAQGSQVTMYAVMPWLRADANRSSSVRWRDHASNSMSSVGMAPIAEDQSARCAGSVTTPNCFCDCASAVDIVVSCAATSPTASTTMTMRARRRRFPPDSIGCDGDDSTRPAPLRRQVTTVPGLDFGEEIGAFLRA